MGGFADRGIVDSVWIWHPKEFDFLCRTACAGNYCNKICPFEFD